MKEQLHTDVTLSLCLLTSHHTCCLPGLLHLTARNNSTTEHYTLYLHKAHTTNIFYAATHRSSRSPHQCTSLLPKTDKVTHRNTTNTTKLQTYTHIKLWNIHKSYGWGTTAMLCICMSALTRWQPTMHLVAPPLLLQSTNTNVTTSVAMLHRC